MRRLSAIGVEKYVASPATVAMTALTGVLTVEVERTDAKYPYWEMPKVWVTVNEFERRYHNRVWNYGDLNSIACEQLFDEACTYRIAPDNFKAIQPYLLAGLDASFAKNVQVGDLMLGGENFGCGKLLQHAVVGLREAGIKAIIVKSVDRRFFRMAANNGLWIIVAPALVEKYRSGDQIEIDVEDERIFLNREEFKLPFIDAAFTEMIRKGLSKKSDSPFCYCLFR